MPPSCMEYLLPPTLIRLAKLLFSLRLDMKHLHRTLFADDNRQSYRLVHLRVVFALCTGTQVYWSFRIVSCVQFARFFKPKQIHIENIFQILWSIISFAIY